MDDHIIFSEVQAFHQNLVVRVVVPLVVVGAGGGLLAIAATSGPILPLMGFAALVALIPVSLMFIKMRTTVTETELRFDMLPLLRRRLPIESIDVVEAVRYNPIFNGGGWGVRLCSRFGLIVNVSGFHGVRVVAGRKRYLLGSRRSEELAAAIEVAREAGDQPFDSEFPPADFAPPTSPSGHAVQGA